MRVNPRRHGTVISSIFVASMLTLCLAGYAQGGWRDRVTAHGRVKMA